MPQEEGLTAHRVDSLTRLAFSIYGSPGVYALLVGSGLSRGAQIPTGWDVTLDLARLILGTARLSADFKRAGADVRRLCGAGI